MPNPQSTEAVITIDRSGTYVDANVAALDLLGVSLAELRNSPADRFAIRPAIETEQAALRDQWEETGSPPLVGTAGLRRADGTTIRISYAIEAAGRGYRARMRPIAGSPDAPPRLFTVGDVLREWRTAERVLAELSPGTPEWKRASGEVDLLREHYQQFFKAATSPSGSQAP